MAEFILAMDHLAASELIDLQPFDEIDLLTRTMPGIGMPKLKVDSKGVNITVGYESSMAEHVWRRGGITIGYEPPGYYHKGGHVIKLGACPHRELNASHAAQGTLGFNCALNPSEARALDTKIDDGKPYSGNAVVMAGNSIQAHYVYRVPGSPNGDSTTTCGAFATNEYKTDEAVGVNGLRGCNFSIVSAF